MIYPGKKSHSIPLSVVSIILLGLTLNLFIKPDLTIRTYCQVYPKEEWALVRGNNGQIISSMIDYTSGHTVQYSLNQFERGEYISLNFSHKIGSEEFVNKGDTIASILSSEVEDQLITAEGELDVARANFKTQNAGEKQSMIEEAENRLKYTDEKIKEQKVLLQRMTTMYGKGLSSQQDYETQKWTLDLLEIEKRIYKAQLENASTGVKEEEIELIESQINSIKSRLAFLKNRKNDLILISPISGYAANLFSPDTLLAIINDKEIVLNVPIKIEDIDLIKKGQSLNIDINGLDKEYSGSVVSISREVKFLNNQQIVFVSVKLDNSEGVLLPGMVKEIFLEIKQISFYEYMKRFLTT